MAIFNPQVAETPDKNYTALSKPIEQPTFQSTAALGLKGMGDVFEKAAKGADLYVEDIAKTETRNRMEAAQEEYNTQLKDADFKIKYAANLQPESSASVATGISTPNILSSGNPPVPQDVSRSMAQLSVLDSARASGKISETDYAARTNSVLKDIRSKYPPAYRDTIDQEAAKILGFNPANKEIQQRIQDINSYLTSSQEEYKHVRNMLLTSKFPNSDRALQNFTSGKWSTQDVKNWMAPYQQGEYIREQARHDLEDQKLVGDTQKTTAEQSANTMAITRRDEAIKSVLYNAGYKSYDQVRQMVLDGLRNKATYSEQQWMDLRNLVQSMYIQYSTLVDNDFTQTSPGKTPIQGIIGDKANEIRKNQGAMFTELMRQIDDKDHGLIGETLRRSQAIDNDAAYRLKTGPNGPDFVAAKLFRDTLGGTLADKLFMNNLEKKIQPQYGNIIDNLQKSVITGDVTSWTMKDALEQMSGLKDRTDTGPQFQFEFPKSARRLFDLFNGPDMSLTSGTTPPKVKENIALKVFGPGNAGMLSNLKPDFYTLQDGREVKLGGAQTTFLQATGNDVVDAMSERSGQAKEYYKNWVETSARKDLMLFDAATLKEMDVNQLKNTTNLELKYNPETRNLEIVDSRGFNIGRRSTRNLADVRTSLSDKSFLQMKDSVSRINTVLNGLNNVGDGMLKDKNYGIKVLLEETGVGELDNKGNTVGFDVLSIPGLPPEITNPVRKEREQELKRREELGKKKR